MGKISFIPLTFIKSKEDLHFQIKNTLIMKNVLEKFREQKELKSLLQKTQYGFTASARDYGDYKLLRITDLKNGKVNWENVPFCDGDCEKYLLKEKDIVIARTGNNKSFLIGKVPKNAVFASYLIRLEVNKELLPEYLYLFLNSYLFWDQVLKMQTGTAIPNVNAEKLKKLVIPYCSIKEQKKIIKNLFDEKSNKEIIKIETFLGNNELIADENFKQISLLTKLKQSILQEAVQGKLVPQNKEDESAKGLLKKIKKEKENLIKEKKIRKEKPLPAIEDDEIPYGLPRVWEWCRLGEVCWINPRNYLEDGLEVAFIPMNLIQDNAQNKHEQEIRKWREIKSGFTHFAEEDVVFAKITPCFQNRKSAILKNLKNKYGAGTTELYVLRSYNKLILPEFLFLLVNTKKFIDDGVATYKGTAGQQRIKRRFVENYIIGLPSFPEQKRIVAKVDELIKYCDELEEKIKENKKNSELLMGAVLRGSFEKLIL